MPRFEEGQNSDIPLPPQNGLIGYSGVAVVKAVVWAGGEELESVLMQRAAQIQQKQYP